MLKNSSFDSDIKILKKFLSSIKQYKITYIIIIILMISISLLSLLNPILWAQFIGYLYKSQFENSMFIILYIGILHLSSLGLNSIKGYILMHLQANVLNDFKIKIFKKILNLKINYFDEEKRGKYTALLQNDTKVAIDIINKKLLNAVLDIAIVIGIGIISVRTNFVLTGIVIFIFPFTYINFKYFGKLIKSKNIQIKSYKDSYISFFQETIIGIREIKCLGVKTKRIQDFNLFTNNIKEKTIDLSSTHIKSQIISKMLGSVQDIGIYLVGVILVARKLITVEIFVAFTVYSRLFISSLKNITSLNSELQNSITSLRRIFNFFDSSTKEQFGVKDIHITHGNIEFKNVNFSFNENKILKNVNFTISTQKKTALVGISGSGKSTIFNLILKLYDIKEGLILIDNININDFTESSLRKSISIIRQEPFLFNDTIKNNLLAINPHSSEEDIITACKKAYIHNFIITLPNQYETIIGEQGFNMSVGQRQRIAIARGLLKQSKIFLFDEVTSALDTESQRYVDIAINSLSKKYTVVVIAHRLASVTDADEVLFIEDGTIISNHNHEELIKKNQKYKNLYDNDISSKHIKENII